MGRVAILVPKENPTVEAEMRRLLPMSVDYVVARLSSDSPDPSQRLIDYAEQSTANDSFGTMELDAIGFACTGSSYLIGAERHSGPVQGSGRPIIYAAAAIADHIRSRHARRIAVISPYPEPLHQAGLRFWASLGFEIAFQARVPIGGADTRAIYRLCGSAAAPFVKEARSCSPDLILLSGTGMPTLKLIDPEGAVPIVSSNHCLAEALIAAVRSEQ
jgi:maleate isomerase